VQLTVTEMRANEAREKAAKAAKTSVSAAQRGSPGNSPNHVSKNKSFENKKGPGEPGPFRIPNQLMEFSVPSS
jgi:hypothetical protein